MLSFDFDRLFGVYFHESIHSSIQNPLAVLSPPIRDADAFPATATNTTTIIRVITIFRAAGNNQVKKSSTDHPFFNSFIHTSFVDKSGYNNVPALKENYGKSMDNLK